MWQKENAIVVVPSFVNMWGPEKGLMDVEWNWDWWGRLGACLQQGTKVRVLATCWGCSGPVECEGSVGSSKHWEPVEREGSVCWYKRRGPACWRWCGGWVSRCNMLTGWRLVVDRWLHCRQSEPGVVLRAVCLVQWCAPMWSAGDVYFLMVGDQLVPKKLLGVFCTLAVLSSLLSVGVKDDADWRRRIWCMWHDHHTLKPKDWAGLVMYIKWQKSRMVKKLYEWKLISTRLPGRPITKWENCMKGG